MLKELRHSAVRPRKTLTTPKSRGQDWAVKAVALLVLIAVLAWPLMQAVGGDWKGQVVDRETGRPVEGAVVMLVWTKCRGGWHGCNRQYYDSEEAVSGADGRFVIPRRLLLDINPFVIRPPYLYVFKGGYGAWNFRGYDRSVDDSYRRQETLDELWRQFQNEGVIIEFPPLKSKEERRKFYGSAEQAPFGVLNDRMKQWEQEYLRERQYFGLR
jgi:hypothetical protein